MSSPHGFTSNRMLDLAMTAASGGEGGREREEGRERGEGEEESEGREEKTRNGMSWVRSLPNSEA